MPLRANRYLVVFAAVAVLIGVYMVGGTSSPTPVTFLVALVFGGMLAAPPVALWYAIDLRRRQR